MRHMRKTISRWLKKLYLRPVEPTGAGDQPIGTVADISDPVVKDSYEIEASFGADAPDQITNPELREDVLLPEIYAEEDVDTVPNLGIPDQPSADAAESAGFNPYDTGVLQRKK